MNQALRRAAKCGFAIQRQQQHCLPLTSAVGGRFGERINVFGNATPLLVPCQNIHYWERHFRHVIRARREKEKFKHPERFAKPTPRYTYVEWNYNAEIFAFGKRLGENFKEARLREALTDLSYIHKERKKQEELGIDTASMEYVDNNKLSELGFQITLDTLTDFLRKEVPKFPPEGHKALIKYLTSTETMMNVASNLGMSDLILCEEYPPNDDTYSRAMFAVIGAVERSSGMERAEKFVIDFIASLLCGKDINEIWDIPRPWHIMTEIAKQRGLDPVEPRLIGEAGRNTIHAAFVVGIYDKNKQLLGTGTGESVDIAHEMAARDVLKTFFNTRDPLPPFEFQSANIPYKLVPHVRNISGLK